MTPAERVERIQREAEGVYAQYGINDASRKFLRDLALHKPRTLSGPQEKWLADIERKVFQENGDGDD